MGIFRCKASAEENRPDIDFGHPVNKQNDWTRIMRILDGDSDSNEYPFVELFVEEEDALEWDVYHSGGLGLYSSKFLDTIGESSLYGLIPLPAYLNGGEYWYLRCEKTIDCIDREKSKFETYFSTSTNSNEISIIFKPVFIESKIGKDICFTLPNRKNFLYMTESIADRLIKANIKGMKLIRDVDMNDLTD